MKEKNTNEKQHLSERKKKKIQIKESARQKRIDGLYYHH